MVEQIVREYVNGEWVTRAVNAGGGGGGGIGTITSTDTSVTVTDPTGPSTNLAVTDSPAVGGIAVSGTPSSGQVLIATGAAAAAWGSLVGALEVLTTLTVDQAAPGGGDVELHSNPSGSNGYVQINGGSGGPTSPLLKMDSSSAGTMLSVTNDAKVGFFGAAPVTRPQVPATPLPQDIVNALVALGLITQAS